MLHRLTHSPTGALATALERFGEQFYYPLGHGRRFKISHGHEYLRFFCAMGSATLFVVEENGEVLGTLARVERWLELPGQNPNRQMVHYLADLKISPRARGRGVLAKIFGAAREQILGSSSRACYAIVMDGTDVLPIAYTGRLGIPVFEPLAKICILRVMTESFAPQASPSIPLTLPAPTCIVSGGDRAARSILSPQRIHGRAWLEDTRRAKRLWTEDGQEMISAHLGALYFKEPGTGIKLIEASLKEAHKVGISAMFFAVPESISPQICAGLADPVQAPATIYGIGISAGLDWWVDTAEI